MCQQHQPVQHVRVLRCEHGTNFLAIGFLQLALTDDELVLLGRAIHVLSYRHPSLQRKLIEGICHDRHEVGTHEADAPVKSDLA